MEAWRPRLPAKLRGEGADGGGEAPGDCADAGRKLASKFYQLSAEEVGVGPGSEDGCGGRDRDLHGNERRSPHAACALPSPASLGLQTLTLSTPLFLAPSNSGGGEGWGRQGQGQGIKVKTGNSGLAVPPTHHGDQETSWKAHSTARSWHGCSSHCTEEETEVQDRARSRVTQPAHNTRQGCGQKLGRSCLESPLLLTAPPPLLPSPPQSFLVV